jgi:predicted lipoprotein
MKMENQYKRDRITSIKITEDVRDWINEIRRILRENLDKPSLSQNETLRWMCVQTMDATKNIYEENYWRKHNTLRQTTEPLNIDRLYESVKAMREQELKEKSTEPIDEDEP